MNPIATSGTANSAPLCRAVTLMLPQWFAVDMNHFAVVGDDAFFIRVRISVDVSPQSSERPLGVLPDTPLNDRPRVPPPVPRVVRADVERLADQVERTLSGDMRSALPRATSRTRRLPAWKCGTAVAAEDTRERDPGPDLSRH